MKTNNAPEETNKKQKEKMPRLKKTLLLLVSLIGSFVLWIYAMGYDSTLFERTFDGVEVVIEGEDALVANKGYTLAEGQKFSSVTVVAKGKRSELNELDASDFRAVIDVSQSQGAGNQTLNIVVYSPNGIEVVSQSSTTATVFVDEFTQRNELLSVSVDIGNNYIMTEGITFVSATANPLSVVVSGPASVLDTVEGAYVDFNLDGREISESLYGYGAIKLRDKNGNTIDNPYVTVSESTAYVTVSVTKQKLLPVRVSFTGGVFDPKDVAVEPSVAYIAVSGSPETLVSINELVLSVDETTVDQSATFDFPVGALLPSGVSNESGVSKITVKVTLPKMAVRTYTVKADKITVENLPEGSDYTINGDLEIKLIGARDAFAGIDRELFSVSVDFNRVTVEPDGSYTAEANISLGGDYSGVYLHNSGYTVNFSVVTE